MVVYGHIGLEVLVRHCAKCVPLSQVAISAPNQRSNASKQVALFLSFPFFFFFFSSPPVALWILLARQARRAHMIEDLAVSSSQFASLSVG